MSRFTNDATGQTVSVADEKDHRFGQGWTPADQVKQSKAEKSETPDDTWTNKELDEYAAANGVDLGGASNKADRLAAIAAAATE